MSDGIIIALITALGGALAGSIYQFARMRHDKKIGLAQQDLAEDDALAKRWEALARTQTESLIEPLRKQIELLEEKVGALEKDLSDSRIKYWRAINHVRALQSALIKHAPDATIPDPHPDITEDI